MDIIAKDSAIDSVIFSTWGGHKFDGRSAEGGGKSQNAEQIPFLPEYFKQNSPLKALIGWDGIVLRDENVNIVGLCNNYMKALSEASCGKCSPCPGGTRAMSKLLDRLCQGKGYKEDLFHLKTIAETVMETSRCGIGKQGPGAILHALDNFWEAFEAAVDNGVKDETDYFSKRTAPCTEACPIHLDIPGYVDHIRQGAFDKSLDLIRSRLPLPGVLGRTCFRPCESNCRRANMDEPIAIKALKRFVADEALKKGRTPPHEMKISEKTGHVAIIGAGPAGLSAAYHLAMRGHKVTMFEMLQEPGGMSAVGIPDYRLPRDILRYEAQLIRDMGVTINYGVRIGRDVLLTDLERDYDAVFISVGAQDSTPMRVEGENEGYLGYIPGIRYLRGINDGYDPYPEGRRVAVVGGGNVAFDCVRTALRHDKDDVSIIYRRTRDEMPADPMEIHEAEEEGANYHFLTAPVRIVADKHGRVTGLECRKMELGEPDASGRRRPVAIEGSEFIFECDTVVSAIGQRVDLSALVKFEGVETTDWNTIVVDPVTRQSTHPKLFAAGDCELGPDSLITAAAGGLRGALSIDSFINDKPLDYTTEDHFEALMKHLKLYDENESMDQVAQKARESFEVLDVEKRKRTWDEVEKSFTRAEAMAEAKRCLHCYRVATVAV